MMVDQPVSQDEAVSVFRVAEQMPELVRIMKKLGLSKEEARAGFVRMVDQLWDDPAPPAVAREEER